MIDIGYALIIISIITLFGGVVYQDYKLGKAFILDDYIIQGSIELSPNMTMYIEAGANTFEDQNFKVYLQNRDILTGPLNYALYMTENREDWFYELPSGETVGYNAFKAVLKEEYK